MKLAAQTGVILRNVDSVMNQQTWQGSAGRANSYQRLAVLASEVGHADALGMAAESSMGDKPDVAQPDRASWSVGRTGRLVERWLPGGTSMVDRIRSMIRRHRAATF